jgi:hypothetical protein
LQKATLQIHQGDTSQKITLHHAFSNHQDSNELSLPSISFSLSQLGLSSNEMESGGWLMALETGSGGDEEGFSF